MSTKYRNYCVACPLEIGCLGSSCPNRNVPVFICDRCGIECDRLYEYGESELCSCCLEEEEAEDV